MTYIRHITLTTGHVRDSYPDEVGAEALAAVGRLIDGIIAGDVAESITIPGVGAYSLNGRGTGRCLVASVYADGPPSVLIATIGVAAHSRCGARLWRDLHRWGQVPVVTDPDDCPPEPWVAAALDEGLAAYPQAAEWLGDFERCLAWAWIARMKA